MWSSRTEVFLTCYIVALGSALAPTTLRLTAIGCGDQFRFAAHQRRILLLHPLRKLLAKLQAGPQEPAFHFRDGKSQSLGNVAD